MTPGLTNDLLPPAGRARRIAVILSVLAVLFSVGCGIAARRAFALRELGTDRLMPSFVLFLVLLLVAMLLRMSAAIGELVWLERTWSNLPEHLRKVGPVNEVSSGLALAVSFVPGVAWVWKLGLIVGIVNGFEALRPQTHFTAPVPRRLGIAAVVVGWVPALNVYVAPFLWELFAMRIDVCVNEIRASGRAPTCDARS